MDIEAVAWVGWIKADQGDLLVEMEVEAAGAERGSGDVPPGRAESMLFLPPKLNVVREGGLRKAAVPSEALVSVDRLGSCSRSLPLTLAFTSLVDEPWAEANLASGSLSIESRVVRGEEEGAGVGVDGFGLDRVADLSVSCREALTICLKDLCGCCWLM